MGTNLKRKILELDNPSVIIKTHPGSKRNDSKLYSLLTMR